MDEIVNHKRLLQRIVGFSVILGFVTALFAVQENIFSNILLGVVICFLSIFSISSAFMEK